MRVALSLTQTRNALHSSGKHQGYLKFFKSKQNFGKTKENETMASPSISH